MRVPFEFRRARCAGGFPSPELVPCKRYRGFESPPLRLGKPRTACRDPVRVAGSSTVEGRRGGRERGQFVKRSGRGRRGLVALSRGARARVRQQPCVGPDIDYFGSVAGSAALAPASAGHAVVDYTVSANDAIPAHHLVSPDRRVPFYQPRHGSQGNYRLSGRRGPLLPIRGQRRLRRSELRDISEH